MYTKIYLNFFYFNNCIGLGQKMWHLLRMTRIHWYMLQDAGFLCYVYDVTRQVPCFMKIIKLDLCCMMQNLHFQWLILFGILHIPGILHPSTIPFRNYFMWYPWHTSRGKLVQTANQ